MGVMICHDQGGLCSLSASSLFIYYLIGKGGYVFGSVGLSVWLFVCLFVCGQHYSKCYAWIGMTFYGGVLGSIMED